MSRCYENHDLNEKTCKFVKKCPDGKVRNENFRCVKAPLNHQTALKQRIEKSKLNTEKRLRERTEKIRNLFKSKTDEWLNLEDSKIREKLMRIKNQTVKRGFEDLTRNVNSLISKVQNYNGTRKTRRPKKKSVNFSPQKRDSKEIDLDDLDLDDVEDLRASSLRPTPENTEVNTPELERELEGSNPTITNSQAKKYAENISKAFSMLDMSKLNSMLGKKTKGLRERRRKGTSMNATVRRTKRSRT